MIFPEANSPLLSLIHAQMIKWKENLAWIRMEFVKYRLYVITYQLSTAEMNLNIFLEESSVFGRSFATFEFK